MTSIHYQHDRRHASDGAWLAVASDGGILLVESKGVAFEAAAQLDALWHSLGSPGGIQATLDELTRGGLSATPSFALVRWDEAVASGPVRAIVRGAVTLTVHAEDGASVTDASGVSTWLEQEYPAVGSFELRVARKTGAGADAPTVDVAAGVVDDTAFALPLRSGAVWADSVIVDRSALAPAAETPPARTASAPAPVASAPVAPARTVVPVPAVPPAPPVPVPAAVQPAPAPSGAAAWVDPEATVTGLTSRAAGRSAALSPETPPAEAAGEGSYDYLFGETVFRTVEDAAVRDEEEVASDASSAAGSSAIGDHDGHTIASADIAKLRAGRKARGTARPPAAAPGPRPYLQLADGSREQLTQPILVGRAPSVSKVSGGQMPKLLTVGGPDQDISRNHAQFAVEGGTVVVTDLHSRNGTMIILPGRPPQQLRQGEPTSVLVGTVIDLGDGVTFTVGEE